MVIFSNLTVKELPADLTQLDATSQKLYSLTEDTKTLMKKLETDINIYVINSEENADQTVDATLKRYAQLSKHIKVEYKDPLISPNFYREFADSVSTNSLIVVSGERSKVIDYNSIYQTEYDYYTYSSTVTGYDAEGETEGAVLASGYVFTDSANSMVSGSNATLFGNMIAQFTGKEDSISIEAKSYSMDNITVTQTAIIMLGLLFAIILPLLILVSGVVIWIRRRRR